MMHDDDNPSHPEHIPFDQACELTRHTMFVPWLDPSFVPPGIPAVRDSLWKATVRAMAGRKSTSSSLMTNPDVVEAAVAGMVIGKTLFGNRAGIQIEGDERDMTFTKRNAYSRVDIDDDDLETLSENLQLFASAVLIGAGVSAFVSNENAHWRVLLATLSKVVADKRPEVIARSNGPAYFPIISIATDAEDEDSDTPSTEMLLHGAHTLCCYEPSVSAEVPPLIVLGGKYTVETEDGARFGVSVSPIATVDSYSLFARMNVLTPLLNLAVDFAAATRTRIERRHAQSQEV